MFVIWLFVVRQKFTRIKWGKKGNPSNLKHRLMEMRKERSAWNWVRQIYEVEWYIQRKNSSNDLIFWSWNETHIHTFGINAKIWQHKHIKLCVHPHNPQNFNFVADATDNAAAKRVYPPHIRTHESCCAHTHHSCVTSMWSNFTHIQRRFLSPSHSLTRMTNESSNVEKFKDTSSAHQIWQTSMTSSRNGYVVVVLLVSQIHSIQSDNIEYMCMSVYFRSIPYPCTTMWLHFMYYILERTMFTFAYI